MSDQLKKKKITDYVPDQQNANLGTEYGSATIERSLRELGPGRSLLADKHGNLIAGNKTQRALIDAGIIDVLEVTPKPGQVVVVKRSDLDLYGEDKAARRMAYFDNRSAELNLAWDVDQILEDLDHDVDMSHLFSDLELDAMATEGTTEVRFRAKEHNCECPRCGRKHHAAE